MQHNISVHGLRTRTTSSLESYNAWIGRMFPKRANFFRFVQILNREINKNYMRLRNAVKNQTFLNVPGRTTHKEQNTNIEKCTQFLNDGIYNVETFFRQVTFLNVVQASSMESNADIEDIEMTICDITTGNGSTKCAICHSNERIIAYMPCCHLAQCANCDIQENCVICGSVAKDVIRLNTTNVFSSL